MYARKKRSYKAKPYARKRAATNGHKRKMAIAAARNYPGVDARTGGYMGIELKFLDQVVSKTGLITALAGSEVDPTGSVDCLGCPAQGDGQSQRDGRRFTIRSVHIKGFIVVNSTESDTAPEYDTVANVALVWDRQTNGAQLNAEDVYSAPSDAKLACLGFRNLQYSRRFIVLKRLTLHIRPSVMNEGAVNLFAAGGVWQPFEIYKKVAIPVTCTGTTNAVSQISDNSLHMIANVDETSGTAGNCDIVYHCRVRFVG